MICDEYATNNALANDAQITRRFDAGLRHRHRGVSNPPGRPRAGQAEESGGCSRPRSISDAAEVGLCAAQTAAPVVLPLSSQVVGAERLASGVLADTGSKTIGFD